MIGCVEAISVSTRLRKDIKCGLRSDIVGISGQINKQV